MTDPSAPTIPAPPLPASTLPPADYQRAARLGSALNSVLQAIDDAQALGDHQLVDALRVPEQLIRAELGA